MKRHSSVFALLLGAFAVVGLSAGAADFDNVMRLSPIGYRLGATGDIKPYDPSVVTVAPSDTSIVYSNKQVTLTADLNRDYRVIRWQKFAVDPRVRTTADPIEEFGAKSETVSVDFNPNVAWMYVTVVVEYDPVRTVKVGLSSFSKGTVTIDPETNVYRRGESVTLTAEPAEGYSFVRWSDGNADHVRRLTVTNDVDLTAYIEPDSSRVSFSAGVGAVLDVTSKRVSYGNAYGELPVPVRTGAKFSGWVDDEKRTVTAKTTVDRVADHTLYASWSDLLYEIAWDFTGRGNGKVDGAGTYAYGSQLTLKAVPYEGSAFVGWTDGVTLNPRRITVLSNALYVAAFDVATYDVIFTYRDASGNLVTTAPTTVEHGGKVDPPPVPEWPEHTFANWSTEEYKKVTRDLKVEAIYDTMTYSVAFAYRDWQGNSVTTMPQHVVSGGKANPPDRSVVDNWTGNTFKGWTPDYNVIRQDTLCEAIYEINAYEVKFTYHGKDGELREQVETVQHGGMVQAVPETAVVDAWPGHRFLGWSNEDYLRPITGKLEVFARYEGYCEIDYGDALGTNLVEEVKDPKDWTNLRPVAELREIEGYAFEKTGHKFVGWKTNETGTVVYGDGARVRVQNGDVLALISKWDPITYTLVFNGNGGTCNVPNEPMTYDDHDFRKTIVVDEGGGPANRHTVRDGYELIGWSQKKKPSAADEVLAIATNAAGAITVSITNNLTAVDGTNVTLYAIWKGKPQTVTIDDGHGGTKDVRMECGAGIDDPGAPADWTGYQFAGWLTNDVAVEKFPITVPVNGITLRADWTTNEYMVAFHGNGADGGAMEPQAFTYDVAQALMANAFTRTGYTFAGWAAAEGSGSTVVYTDQQVVKNLATNDGAVVDLYATWTMNPRYYAVRFNPNSGEGEAYVQDIECGVATALTSNRFARTGYGFAGWAAAEGSGSTVVYTHGQIVTDLASEGETNDLYAVWTANRYWVAFEGNGADGGTMEAQAFTYDVAEALTSNAFTRTGYGFAGWAATEDSGSTVVYADSEVVSNLTAEADATNTLWATWTANTYTVRFNPNGGSGDVITQGFTYDQSQNLANNTFEPPEPLKSFAGWATNETGKAVYANGAEIQNLTAEADGTVDLYAVWGDDSYTVAFDGNGATGGTMEPQVFKHGGTDTLTPNAYVRTGCGFANWTNVSKNVYSDGASFTAPATGIGETLYAVWTNNTHDCTFGRSEDNQRRKYGEKLDPLPGEPSKTGYTFEGWTTNGTDKVDLESFTMPDYDVVFTPLWTPITYTIAFDGNGTTSGAMTPTNVKYDVEIALPSNHYVWAGHEFVRWTNSVGNVFEDGASVKNLATTDGAIVTLYAVWQETGNPLAIALGLDANFDVEVSPEGAWTIIGDAKDKKGLSRTSSSPAGTLRVTVPSGGMLKITFEPQADTTGLGLTVTMDGDPEPWFEDEPGFKSDYPLETDKGGTFVFSGVPSAGATWTLKEFSWAAK